MSYTDIHSHILYGLDDGARSLEESVQMLEIARRAGTGAARPFRHDVAAAPGAAAYRDHFAASDDVDRESHGAVACGCSAAHAAEQASLHVAGAATRSPGQRSCRRPATTFRRANAAGRATVSQRNTARARRRHDDGNAAALPIGAAPCRRSVAYGVGDPAHVAAAAARDRSRH